MSHVNARLTVHGRRLIVDRVAAGRPVAHIAAELGVSRQTAYRWVRRFRTEGTAGLRDRSSRPKSLPTRTGAEGDQAVLEARRSLRPLGVETVTGEVAVNLMCTERFLAHVNRGVTLPIRALLASRTMGDDYQPAEETRLP